MEQQKLSIFKQEFDAMIYSTIEIQNINETVFDYSNNFGIGNIVFAEKLKELEILTIKFNKEPYNTYKYSTNGFLLDCNYEYKCKYPTLFSIETVDVDILDGEYTELPLTITKNLYPGQKVLCKRYSNQEWTVSLFSYYNMRVIPEEVTKNFSPYICGNDWYKFCIPLEGFEEYVGTLDIPDICKVN